MKKTCGSEQCQNKNVNTSNDYSNNKDQSANYNDNNSRVPNDSQSIDHINDASGQLNDVYAQSKPSATNEQDADLDQATESNTSCDDYGNGLVKRDIATTSVNVDKSGGNPKVFSVPRCTSDEIVKAISNRRSTNVSTLSYC